MAKTARTPSPPAFPPDGGPISHVRAPEKGIFCRTFGKIQKCLGFYRGYNVPLWLIFSSIIIGFVMARVSYLNIDVVFRDSSAPGEYFWLRDRLYRIGMILHLACILPCGFLSVFQFLPIIRHKLIIIHRINGYLVLLLLCGGVAGAIIITRHAFGGEVSTQAASGTISLATIISAILAYYNIKRLQIDQHRKWMLRTMFYMGSIVTTRVIMGAGMAIIANIGTYSTIWDCAQLADEVTSEHIQTWYPACVESMDNKVIVPATFDAVETVGSALRISFGMGLWLAFIIHAFGIELYIRLTPGESERLRIVSYERQLEAGMTNAGSVGTTSDRLGDAKWKPSLLASEDDD